MTVVGECNFYTPPKEQVPKKPLELISQVDGTTAGRNSGERIIVMPPKGNVRNRTKLSGKKDREGNMKLHASPSSVLFCVQKSRCLKHKGEPERYFKEEFT